MPKKKKQKTLPKPRNPEATKLQNPAFKKQVIPTKKKPEPDAKEDWG